MKFDLKDSEEKKQKSKPRTKKSDEKVKKIRLLGKEIKKESKKRTNLQMFIIPVLISFTSLIIYQLSQIKSCEFWSAYERNFNKVVYGDEYFCIRLIDSQFIYNQLKTEVAAQEDALELIRGSLELANKERIVRIAFNGGVGTGKSLAASIITRHFMWKRNVQKLSWEDDMHISSLSKCGFNLIIIDNMNFNSTTMEYAKNLEQELLFKSKGEGYRVILILIFKGSHEELIEDDKSETNGVQDILKNFVVVDFHPITRDGLEKCIEIHQILYNIKMTPQELMDLKEINFKTTGCKLISKRLNLVKL